MPSAVSPTMAAASTSALSAAAITTSEQLVKALRVPQPPANGVSKVSIAAEAWHSPDFFVLRKAELISQWVLEHLCSSLRGSAAAAGAGTPTKGKAKAKQPQKQKAATSQPELDLEAWELLASILAAQTGPEADLSEAAKRSWLSHLANTQPVLQLAGSFARQLEHTANCADVLSSATASLAKLLPPATSRTAATNVEAATDAIHAWLEFFGQPRSASELHDGLDVLKAIVATWTTTLQYGSNAKRNHHHFCTRTLPALLRALHVIAEPHNEQAAGASTASLLELVNLVAAESLFTEDVLRAMLQAGRSAETNSSITSKGSRNASTDVVQQLVVLLQEQHTGSTALSSLPVLSELLYARLSRSESLNSVASTSSTSAGSMRETQLALVRKTMLSEWLFPLLPFLTTAGAASSSQTSAERAAARKGLLAGIERDNLYILGCDEHDVWRSLFGTLFKDTLDDLERIATNEGESAQAEIAEQFEGLALLWRLEKSIVEGDLVAILAMAAVQPFAKDTIWRAEELPSSSRAALHFVREVAAIDVRFRTLPTLVNHLMRSLPLAAERLAQQGSRTLAASLFSSQTFLAELARLCRDSLTAVQVPDLVGRLAVMVQDVGAALASIKSDTGKAAKRQRRSSTSGAAANTDTSALIAQLRLAAQVVQSVNLAPALRARSIAAAEELHTTLILPCLDVGADAQGISPPAHGVAAAALQLRQALLAEKWRYNPSEPVKLDGSLPTESLTCLEEAFDERADSLLDILLLRSDDASLCQLQLQILQALLHRAERDAFLGHADSRYCQLISDQAGPVGKLLHEIVALESDRAAGTVWSGRPTHFRGRGELVQAVWLAIVTRWAPLLDRLANEPTLTQLAAAVIASAAPGSPEDSARGCMRRITTSTLRNAAFLELPNARRHIVAAIQQRLDTETLPNQLAATAVLCVTPPEWILKSARGALLTKLLALDRTLASAQPSGDDVAWTERTELRRLIARLLDADFATEADTRDVDLLSSLRICAVEEGENAAWQRVSLTTIRAMVRVLLQRSASNASTREALVQQASDARQEADENASQVTFKMRASQTMAAALSEVDATARLLASNSKTRAGDSLEAIKTLSAGSKLMTADEVTTALNLSLYHLRELRLGGSEDGAALSKDVVTALCTLLARVDGQVELMRTAGDVALELLRCLEGAQAVGACLAYSALVSSLPELHEQARVREGLQRLVSHLDAAQYDVVLTQLLAALSASATTDGGDADVGALIGTIGLALGSAPEGTSKIARSHLAHWLSLLVGTTVGPVRARAMVASVSALDALCGQHAMLLRTQDVHAVLQLFSTLVGPSARDEVSPAIASLSASRRDAVRSEVFGGLVSTLSSLMRLRQDVVASALPQLGALLARLCTLFRQLRRTGASGMQRRQLRRELPAWLDPVHVTPLGEAEARALSRLLAGLVAKNVPLQRRGEEAKAQSLAKPFSKHATYVLVAYLRCLTAPNAVVTPEVRKELDTGMLTLCGIMGHHQRDAAMVGMLDAAGRILLKRVWAEYEKQRYKGQ